ncbi:glycosyltransferase family A protein [Brevibacterium sp. 'Marine']|uniref:glycosyltransferase family 2 protein n=1 Tax=Brevibacterium sp. 'Marine' TaxID=2725563 RepID=UPI00145EFC5D|nr:glycosyltransferase family A protein [Brevibacterium sp. 'Marine']
MNTEPQTTTSSAEEFPIDVSVVIPVYNCARYLEETIGSVRSQDISPGSYEIIAVDDGSTDDSLQILERLAAGSSDMRVFSIPNSGSAAAPRNRGLDEMRGRYVFFLDADDKLEPDTLRRVVTVADETGSGVVLCKMGEFGAGKRAGNVPSTAFGATKLAVDFVESRAVSTLGALKLFRTSIVKEHGIRFPLGFVIGEDQAFTMRAYLHSPHVSILADKVYYWARGRGDGTNVTSTGQPPRKHLMRVLTLVRTIVENTEPGELRDRLLRRPIIGAAGVESVFGKKMLPAHDRAEREVMVNEFREVVAPHWKSSIRDHGVLESQILADLAVRGDVDEIETVSRLVADKKPVPIRLDEEHGQLVYEPRQGADVGDLRIRLDQSLESLTTTADALTIRGEFGVAGLDRAPDSAQFIFRHRKLGTKVTSKIGISRTYNRSFGTRVRFSTDVPVSILADSGIWELFIKAKWSSTVVRERFGISRAAGLDIAPRLIGDPVGGIVFFDQSDGLSVDVGPTEKHLEPVKRHELHVVDQFEVGRSRIFVISGPVSTMKVASYQADDKTKSKSARLVVHSTDQASVILPRSAARRPQCTIELTDAEGNSVDIVATGVRAHKKRGYQK